MQRGLGLGCLAPTSYTRAVCHLVFRADRSIGAGPPARSAIMAKFSGADFYEIGHLLNEDEIQIRDHVRDWVEDRYLPLIETAYEEGYFPAETIPEIAEMGLLGATLPEKYGCAGVSPTA